MKKAKSLSRSSPASAKIIQHLSNDTWSNIIPFLATHAWSSAIDVANITQTCRAWRTIPLWVYYTQAFRIFPFHAMPAPVKALMKAAFERQGFVNQKTAMDHLKLSAIHLKNVSHKILRLGMGRKMYLYDVGDVLRKATDRFKTVEAMEKHILQCKQRQARRIQNFNAKEQRRENVRNLLSNLDANFILARNMDIQEINDYVQKNRGSLHDIRAVVLLVKQQHDAEQARVRLIKMRRTQYRAWIDELRLTQEKYLQLPSVQRFIYQGIGSKDEIVQAVQAEFAAEQTRLAARVQQAPSRRQQLVAALEEHGLQLRNDSKFCRQFIRGETTASLQEVVATMKLTSYLFGYGHQTWSRWHHVLETSMRIKMHTGQFDCWLAACQNVIETNVVNIQNGDDGHYDEYDYDSDEY